MMFKGVNLTNEISSYIVRSVLKIYLPQSHSIYFCFIFYNEEARRLTTTVWLSKQNNDVLR